MIPKEKNIYFFRHAHDRLEFFFFLGGGGGLEVKILTVLSDDFSPIFIGNPIF